MNAWPFSLNDCLQMPVISRLKFDCQRANHWHYSNPNSSECSREGGNHFEQIIVLGDGVALTVGYVHLSICRRPTWYVQAAIACHFHSHYPIVRLQLLVLVLILGRLLECLDISRKCQKYKAAKASSNNAVAAAPRHIIKMSIPSKSHARRQREG